MPTSTHAGCTDFTEIPGESVGTQRADVGIGPYRVLRKSDSLPLYSDGIASAWIGRMTSAVNFPFSV